MMELLRAGVQPCLPQKTLPLPGGVELRMCFIPPRSFLMASPEAEVDREEDEAFCDETLHLVTLTRGFWMGVTPVTQAQWRAIMGTEPSYFKGDELPVEGVSWDDATAFCGEVSDRAGVTVRLPTEAEWEYACRAGTTTPFYWGAELNGTQANCDGNYPYGTQATGPSLKATTAVGSYAGVSPHPWGLADVIGNVRELCADWYGSYPEDEAVDPVGPESGPGRVFRGGSSRDGTTYCLPRGVAEQEMAGKPGPQPRLPPGRRSIGPVRPLLPRRPARYPHPVAPPASRGPAHENLRELFFWCGIGTGRGHRDHTGPEDDGTFDYSEHIHDPAAGCGVTASGHWSQTGDGIVLSVERTSNPFWWKEGRTVTAVEQGDTLTFEAGDTLRLKARG